MGLSIRCDYTKQTSCIYTDYKQSCDVDSIKGHSRSNSKSFPNSSINNNSYTNFSINSNTSAENKLFNSNDINYEEALFKASNYHCVSCIKNNINFKPKSDIFAIHFKCTKLTKKY